jgi:hypothetical protein
MRSPATRARQMIYFVRDPNKFVTRENVGSVIFFGVIRGGDPLSSLLNLMHGIYVPVVVSNTRCRGLTVAQRELRSVERP